MEDQEQGYTYTKTHCQSCNAELPPVEPGKQIPLFCDDCMNHVSYTTVPSELPSDVVLKELTDIISQWRNTILQIRKGKKRLYIPLTQVSDPVEVAQYVFDRVKALLNALRQERSSRV